MIERIRKWYNTNLITRLIYTLLIVYLVLVFIASQLSKRNIVWLFLGLILTFFFVFRPNSKIHRIMLDKMNIYKIILIIMITLTTILIAILPMSKLPLWNGNIPDHRNQYELMAENILAGRFYFDYGDEDELSQLNNPYDPAERSEAGINYHWDHAYYKGNYYMYFGVVPVFLVFLPYLVIVGTSLTTYNATQLFVAIIIIGTFSLFRLLARLFFSNIPFSVYIFLSVAFSIMSVWYSIAEPALYCTVITAAIALEIWSLYFFVKAVWLEKNENTQLFYAGIGAVLGALVFGCRPTIAIANFLVIPMLFVF